MLKRKKILLDALLVTVGCALLGLSVALFYNPYHIVPGGVTGLAMVLFDSTGFLSIGAFILLLNIPLAIMSRFWIGHVFLLGTLFGTIVSSLFVDLFGRILTPPHVESVILAAVAGAVLMGAGLGLIFLRGYTTGGSDVAARLLKLLFPSVQMGHLMLAIDVVVVGLAGLYYGKIENMLLAAVAIYITSAVVNTVVYGASVERVALIISDEPDLVVGAIEAQLKRGATLLHGEGGYTRTARRVVLCAIKRQQSALLKDIVKQTDPAAFLIVCSANEVMGEGFQDYNLTKL